MTEAEAKAAAKTLRRALVGVTAATDPNGSDKWGVREWAPDREVFTSVDSFPQLWQKAMTS